MAVKNVLLAKKSNGTVYDCYPKTDSAIVVFNNTTVYAALTALQTTVGDASSGLVQDVADLRTDLDDFIEAYSVYTDSLYMLDSQGNIIRDDDGLGLVCVNKLLNAVEE